MNVRTIMNGQPAGGYVSVPAERFAMHAYIGPANADTYAVRLAREVLDYLGACQRADVRIPAALAEQHMRLVDLAHGVDLAMGRRARDAIEQWERTYSLILQGRAP